MSRPTCETCPFWNKRDYSTMPISISGESTTAGQCRAHSPTKCGSCGINTWPTTGNADWCGEHPGFANWMRRQSVNEPQAQQCHVTGGFIDGHRCRLPVGHDGMHEFALVNQSPEAPAH